MIVFGGLRKIIMPMVGLVSGILLFLASFSMLINSIVFNSEFQKETFENLGMYKSVSELAETFSSDTDIISDQYQPIVKSNITQDLVSINLKSLIEGLTEYFKGNTDSLPDLHLAGINDTWSLINDSTINATTINDTNVYGSLDAESQHNNADISSPAVKTAAAAQPLASLDKINLNVLFMIFGERHITDILLVISLFQFIFSHIPIFALMFFITLFAIMLNSNLADFRVWLKSSVTSFFLLCLAAGCLIQLIFITKLPYLLSLLDKLEPISEGVLSGYITYCTNTLSVQIILSGIILFCTVQASVYLFENKYQSVISVNCSLSCSLEPSFIYKPIKEKAHKIQSQRKTSILIYALIALLGISVYVQTNTASHDFIKRNLGRAISFLHGNNYYYQIVNARNEQVYLLDVKVLDSITQLPVKDLGAKVRSTDGNELEPIRYITDSEGSTAFLLDKGNFKLVLDSVGPLTSYSIPNWPSYEFEMTTPGKEELTIMLDRHIYGLPYITGAFKQYIP